MVRATETAGRVGLFAPGAAFTIRMSFPFTPPARFGAPHVLSLLGVLGITLVLFIGVAATAKLLFDSPAVR